MKISKSFKRIVLYIMLLLFICIFIYSSYRIVLYIINSNKNKEIKKSLTQYVTIDKEEDQDKIKVDFNSLKEENQDTIGYLKIDDIEIETIVVQGLDNKYYLNHNFEKEENNAGWIFADYRNRFDGTDKNIIIYGHNMKDGTMFSKVKNVLESDWQQAQENHSIIFVTEKDYAIYDIFSVYQIEEEDYYITTDFENDEEYLSFLEKIKNRSTKDFEIDLNKEDTILTLSTCASNNDLRVVVHAVKVKE
jgi:sortase B